MVRRTRLLGRNLFQLAQPRGPVFVLDARNEVAARRTSAKVATTRRMTYVVEDIVCGVADAVVAVSQSSVQPGNEFQLQFAAEMLVAILTRGLGSLESPILGSIICFTLQ